MESLLLQPPRSSFSLTSLSQSRCTQAVKGATHADGTLLEWATLELRVHPPNVEFNNNMYPNRTVITIDSANRPGTLVEVVQWLTELGLNVYKARISSDGGWFHDEFTTDRISSKEKELEVKRVLSAEEAPAVTAATAHEETVFELAGPDRAGLLADVVNLLTFNGCDVRSAAVWTSNGRAAIVVSVLEQPAAHAASTSLLMVSSGPSLHVITPTASSSDLISQSSVSLSTAASRGHADRSSALHAIRDPIKLTRLKDMLARLLEHVNQDDVIVEVSAVRGALHFDRRLHQLLLKEEEVAWLQSGLREEYEALVGDGLSALPVLTAPAPSPRQHTGAELKLPPSSTLDRPFSLGSPLPPYSPTCTLDSPVSAPPGSAYLRGPASQPLHRLSSTSSTSQVPGCPASSPPLSATLFPATSMDGALGHAVGVARQQHVQHAQHQHVQHVQHVQQQPLLLSPKYCKPEVRIRQNSRLKYWLVDIRCKDRKKLFFDTVCTLADLQYDIYHASVDVEGETAHQVYYIRRQTGDASWCQEQAATLCYLLEASIQRRFPKGVKIRIQSWRHFDLAALTTAWRDAGLIITRAKVSGCMPADAPCAPSLSAGGGAEATGGGAGGQEAVTKPVTNTFYLLDQSGSAPDTSVIQRICADQGGVSLLVEDVAQVVPPSPGPPSASGYAGIRPGGTSQAGAASRGTSCAQQGLDPVSKLHKRPGAAFGFALLHRGWSGSPSSIASSM